MWNARLLIAVFAALACAHDLCAQEVNLTEAPLAQACVRNEITMQLEGKITAKQDGKDLTFPHKADAKHVYMERYLDVSAGIAEKAARFYTTADSTIAFNNNDASKRSLRQDRRFIVAHRVKDHLVSYSLKGALTREEMEVTEHFDTLAIAGLLPNKTLAVGKTWAVPNHIVAALCDLDGVTEQNLEGKLESVKDNVAQIKIVGKAQGINLGAQVTMLINAVAEFDIKAQRIVSLEWNEVDGRQQGPVTPALSADVKIKLTRTPIEEPEQLNKFALVPIPAGATPPTSLTNLHHVDGAKRFTLAHARDWHVVSPEDSPQLVLRQLERGDFIGQVTLTMWKKTDPNNVMKLADFAELMAKTPGWTEEKEIERKELKNLPKGHHTVYRVGSSGDLEGAKTVQYYYLIVSATGEQLIVTFSVVPQHVQRFATRDLDFVREIAFPEEK